MPLTVIVAGRTAPNRAVRFGGEHDPLDDRGRCDIERLDVAVPTTVRVGPEASVRETARMLGIDVEPDRSLATVDIARWSGLEPTNVPTDELEAWFTDPDSRPHGGETITEFVSRIVAATQGFDGLVVVASPVAQALVARSPREYFTVSIRPGSVLTPPTPHHSDGSPRSVG
ncbi:histidine phosphatase family protein [Gordonia malaquae]|uniref:Phosphoglycerate mutase family protein n=1 Tax=Gordonia malaquae NBRC 108250 TaxID=1223542 RepID=M3VG74_GORML|nr:histidine phosphatase family protein [Gordonia malaquae]GAC80684.1 phosphoglycerate mutase family protein [Gordonia malaquae NBRC 108250]SEC22279.1 Histidine phosphatase superfamily (branch 1) [Gordonia malaquae]